MARGDNPRTSEFRDASLSFGVVLTSSVTGNPPGTQPKITIEELDVDPVRTPSGYYVFTNLSDFALEKVHLTIDAGREFFVEERTVVLDPERADYDPDDPETVVVDEPTEGIHIELTPTPAYRFPYTVTHVRGHVDDADGNPVSGATVSLPEFDVSVESVDEGEFALHVPVEKKQVYKTNGKKLVKLNGNGNGNGTNGGRIGTNGHLEDPTIEVTHPEHGSYSGSVEVEAGTRTVHYVTLE